ncbi:hypothetical protein AVEN_275694-1 [Araneus ventricosus]|uniref:Uncharacterized protein n=1 Tax=Araneus ventricosus TaxID=182803 RepID=A0A4Y2W720_ARAVE|nr:hypothetical protein AVEN_275694-1 [Araneus ventricosus]
MQKDSYFNKKESQVKKSKKTSFYCKFHNFHVRGSSHLVNVNSKHVSAQINSRRRIKAREKSVELKLPVRTFDDETRLTASELLQVLKNKEVRWFKNGTSVPEEHSTYLSEPFNPHKAKKIYASRGQREAEKYFVKVVKEKFRSLKTSKAPDVLAIREEVIEKVFARFKNRSDIRAIMVYVKNLWITFDEHLYSTMSMKEKVDRHIDFIIKNTNQEREEELLAAGATPGEVYQIFRTVQGYNLYLIRLLSERGGAALEIYIRKELQRRLKLLFNRFKDRMIRIGVDTEKDFFSIARRHFSFLFTKKYVKNRKKIMREVRHILALIRENPFDVLKDYDNLCKFDPSP